MAKIRNDWPGLFSFTQNGLYRIFNEAQFIQQQLFLNSFQSAVDYQISAHLKLQKVSSMNEIELLQFLFGPLIMCKLVDY